MKKIQLQAFDHNSLKIRKRTFLQWLTFVVALWTVLFMPISGLPGPLSYLKFTPDGILFALLLLALVRKKTSVKKKTYSLLIVVIGFFFYCLLTYIIQYQSIAYFFWGVRNVFRFYVAFFAFITYLDTDDVTTWTRIMDCLFWVNVAITAFQFFVIGLSGDWLGGIFGTKLGSNGYTMCFLSIVVGKSFLEAFNEQERLINCFLKGIVSLMIAAMAEMKFFFFLFVFLLVFAAAITRFSVKKLLVMVLTMIAVMISAMLLIEWFGFQDFFTLQGLMEYATKQNYSTNGDINRLSAIPSLIKRLDIGSLQQVFGLGLGNCDTSAFAVCNTPFYRRYGDLHYTWFTAAMMFLETGFIGLLIYVNFFIVCFKNTYRRFKSKTGNLLYNQQALMFSILCIILAVYNSSLRGEAAYMMYFVLALPFIPEAPKETSSEMIVT